MIYINTIDIFNSINGEKRPPNTNEHKKVLRYNNDTGFIEYVDIPDSLVIPINDKLNDGIVRKGDDGAPNYVWKLDENLNPSWRKENDDVRLNSIIKENGGNRAEFELTDGSKLYLNLGALAWKDDIDFTAGFDYQVLFNKAGTISGDNKLQFDYINNQIKLQDTNGLLVKKSTVDSEFIKVLNYLGAGVLELGDNVYIKEAIKVSEYKGNSPLGGMIQYVNNKPQWYDGTKWNDFANNTDTFINQITQVDTSDSVSSNYKLTFKLNDGTTFYIQLGANAFNSKFIPTVSGEDGYIQLSNGATNKDLKSSADLSFINNTLKVNGILSLSTNTISSLLGSDDGSIVSGDDGHTYSIYSNTSKRLDNIDYALNKLGTGKHIVDTITDIDGNNKSINVKSLIEGSNITISEVAGGLQIDSINDGTGGEVNIGTSLGTGIPVYKDKDGVALRYHSIKQGNGIGISLVDDDIVITATDSNANYYLNSVGGQYNSSVTEDIYPISNDVNGKKPINFNRYGLTPISVNFGNNAFNSEPIRNITKFGNKLGTILNTGTSDDKYKLRIESNNSDEGLLKVLDYQLGINAFNSYKIHQLVSDEPMTWDAGARRLTSNINYKEDASRVEESKLSTFDIILDETLTYNPDTKVLGVPVNSNKYLVNVSRFPDTNHLVFTMNDDSTIVYSGLGDLAFTDNIPIATSSILGGVKIGSGINVAADGTISVSPSSGPDISRLVSYDVQSEFSVGDKQQARANILSAYINGDTNVDFNANYLNLQRLLDASHVGWPSASDPTDIENGYHKLAALRMANNSITTTWGTLILKKLNSYLGVGEDYLDFVVGSQGNMYWYSYIDNIKTRIMALKPRVDQDQGLVYDLHLSGEIVEFSNSL